MCGRLNLHAAPVAGAKQQELKHKNTQGSKDFFFFFCCVASSEVFNYTKKDTAYHVHIEQ